MPLLVDLRKHIGKAMGLVATMIVKRTMTRRQLNAVKEHLDRATECLNKVVEK